MRFISDSGVRRVGGGKGGVGGEGKGNYTQFPPGFIFFHGKKFRAEIFFACYPARIFSASHFAARAVSSRPGDFHCAQPRKFPSHSRARPRDSNSE